MSRPCVVIAKEAYEAWRPLFDAAALPVRYALLQDAETAFVDGEPCDPGRIPANAIWLTLELLLGPLRQTCEHLLETAPDLEWAHSISAGYDSARLQNLLKRGVRLTVSHVNAIPIAEYVMRTVLDRFQRVDLTHAARARREYPEDDFREIFGSTWLVYGVGAIGGRIGERARAFGAHVIGVRRNPTGSEPVDEMIGPAQVFDHLGRADVVVMSVPSSGETNNLVDEAFLARMKPGATFVNVARANLMDEAAVLAALDRGHLDYAILDVHSIEMAWLFGGKRMDDSRLWTHPKVDLTPHVAGRGAGRHKRSAELFIDNLRRYLAGERPLTDEVRP